MEDNFGLGYAMGSDAAGGSRNDGFWGGDGWWAIIIFAMIFGWGNGGFGGWGGNGGGYAATAATQADLQRGFDTRTVISKLDGINSGICDGFYAMNTGMLTGFNGMNTQIAGLGTAMQQGFNAQTIANMQGQNALSRQLADCCCENRQGQAEIKYQMATDTCALQTAICNAARDITDNANANYRGLMDFMVQSKISALESENQSLRLAASQSNQNAVLQAAMNANTAELIHRINPTPVGCHQRHCADGINNGCGCC
nr:MAG TPA: hypothetical protein [Caudoviricetes sp.]